MQMHTLTKPREMHSLGFFQAELRPSYNVLNALKAQGTAVLLRRTRAGAGAGGLSTKSSMLCTAHGQGWSPAPRRTQPGSSRQKWNVMRVCWLTLSAQQRATLASSQNIFLIFFFFERTMDAIKFIRSCQEDVSPLCH